MKLRKKVNKIPFFILFFYVLFSYFLYLQKDKYIINPSKSLTRGIYKLYPATNIKKGDIVLFKISNDLKKYSNKRRYILNRTNTLLKRVAAFSEDEIEIRNNEIFIDKESWGKIYKWDSRYMPLPELGVEKIKPGKDEFLPLSKVDKSFDGRYFGPIKNKEIQAKAELFFKF